MIATFARKIAYGQIWRVRMANGWVVMPLHRYRGPYWVCLAMGNGISDGLILEYNLEENQDWERVE